MPGFFRINTRTSQARNFANQLIAQGSQTTPAATPLAGIARAVQGLTGGFVRGQETRREEALGERQQEALSRALAFGPTEAGGQPVDPTIASIAQSLGAEKDIDLDPSAIAQLRIADIAEKEKVRVAAKVKAQAQAETRRAAKLVADATVTAATLKDTRTNQRLRLKSQLTTNEFDRLVGTESDLMERLAEPGLTDKNSDDIQRELDRTRARINKLTTVTGTTEQDPSFTSSQVGKRRLELEQDERSVAGLVRGSERVFDLLDKGTEIGFTGSLVSAANAFASQSKALAKAAGKVFVDAESGAETTADALLDPNKYDFGELSKLGQNAARVQATMMNLAFSLASQQNKGRISDRDVQAALTQLGANVGDKATFKAILTDRIQDTIAGHNFRRTQVLGPKAEDVNFGFTRRVAPEAAAPTNVPTLNLETGIVR